MTPSCDEVNARLLDLIYGEGSASDRRELEDHVEGCARCHADLDALGRARATVRARLADDTAPPRARARILEVARQALATGPAGSAMAARAQTAASPDRAARRPLWERLRGRWTLPTLATVGAVALMLLGSRVLLDPRGTTERGKQALAPQATAVSAPVGRTDDAAARAPVLPAPASPATGDAFSPKVAGEPRRLRSSPRHRADAARASAPAVAAPAATPRAARPPSPEDTRDLEFPAPGASAGAVGRSVTGGKDDKAPARAEAPANLPGPGEPPPPPERAKPAKKEASASPLEESSAPRRPAAPAPPRADSSEEVAELEKLERSSTLAKSAPTSAKRSREPLRDEGAAKQGPTESEEAMVRRADRLYAERHWQEAAAVYEELLRRYPGAEGVPRWRVRVVTARRAAAPPPAAPASAAPPR